MVVHNKFLLDCWELADNSECSKMRFGALIVLDGKVIGKGWNRCPSDVIKDYCNPCLRASVPSGTNSELCTAIHAEQAAFIDAFKNGYSDLSEATMYLAGKYGDGRIFLDDSPEVYCYCTYCTRLVSESGIEKMVVPVKDGDSEVSMDDALRISFDYARRVKKI